MKFIDVGDSENEVNSATALEHCFKLLDQSNPQRTGSHGSDRRFSFRVLRLDFESQPIMIERERLFKFVHFKEQKIETGDHQLFVSSPRLRSWSKSDRRQKLHRKPSTRTRSPELRESAEPDARGRTMRAHWSLPNVLSTRRNKLR